MSKEQYLSTGEAARILNISRSTVSRRFDAGQLEGRLNPITGERLISRSSIEDTIRKHNLPVDIPFLGLKNVIVGTANQELSALIASVVGDDTRLQIEVVTQGADALIACSRSSPDLLIIDDQLPDLRGSHVIKSLRKHVDMGQIKILYCGKQLNGTANLAAMGGADASIDMGKGEDREELKSTIYRLLSIPSEASSHKGTHEHKRRWPRFPVELDAQLAVFPTARPDEKVPGTAKIRNISRGGAYLTDIFLGNATLPGEPFCISLAVDEDPLRNWKAQCSIMRLQSNDSLSAGVQFETISEEDRQRILQLKSR